MARKITGSAAVLAMALALPAALPASAQEADTVDGLHEVDSRKFDQVFLLPGADFGPYAKVIIDDPEVAFRRNWVRDYNRDVRGLDGRISDSDAEEILASASDGLAEVYAGAFGKAGYEIVAAGAADVLRIKVSIINLEINAPDVDRPSRSRSYATEAGEATIIVEARDSLSGALLGRAVDSSRIGDTGFMTVRSSVSNRSDFSRAFKRWAELSVDGLEALKANPPAGEDS